MDVYLLRHAVAEDRDAEKFPNDDDRPLTAEGVSKMKLAADGIAELIEPPDVILTSPLPRTLHTAEIVARALGCKDRVEASDMLKPGAKVDAVRKELIVRGGQGVEGIMLVGHEPDMGAMASAMIGAKGATIEFKKGSLCAIRLDAEHFDRPGVLLWHVTPKQLRAIGKRR